MKRILLNSALAAALCLAGGAALAQTVSPSIRAAVSDPARPPADVQRDATRKPAEVLAFAGVKPGDKVGELIPGGGYFTRVLAKAVGPSGHVYAIVPTAMASRPGALDGINAVAAAYPNVTVVTADLAMMSPPEKLDVVWTSENYHDLHNGPTANIAGFNKAVFDALKPGGVFYVEDHSAPGTGTSATSTLHRIDPAAAKSEIEAAGFRMEAQTDLLANSTDPHTDKVFDPKIQGHTDKFVMRFRKPR